MIKITKIAPGRRGKLLIYANGKYLAAIDPQTAKAHGIEVGAQIEPADLPQIISEKIAYKAREKAFNLLTMRNHSKKELFDKLNRNFGEKFSGEITEKMQKSGLVNDKIYAENFANHLKNNKKFAISRIKQELKLKGISSEIIEEILENSSETDEKQAVENLLETKFAGKFSDEKSKKRTVAALQRLGYSWRDIQTVLNQRGKIIESF